MTHDPNDVVRVHAGPLVEVEAYHQALTAAGIESKVVGGALSASFGSAMPDSIELWVHRKDVEKAGAAIRKYEEGRTGAGREHPNFPHPTSDPKPGHGPARKEPYVNPDPHGN